MEGVAVLAVEGVAVLTVEGVVLAVEGVVLAVEGVVLAAEGVEKVAAEGVVVLLAVAGGEFVVPAEVLAAGAVKEEPSLLSLG